MAEIKNSTNFLESISTRVPEWIGTPYSLVVHTVLFVGIFSLNFFGVGTDEILLILTTLVSLEAIYLAIFIQITVNRQAASLKSVEEDVEELSEDVEDISEDIDEIQADDEEDESKDQRLAQTLQNIEKQLQTLQEEISSFKKSS